MFKSFIERLNLHAISDLFYFKFRNLFMKFQIHFLMLSVRYHAWRRDRTRSRLLYLRRLVRGYGLGHIEAPNVQAVRAAESGSERAQS